MQNNEFANIDILKELELSSEQPKALNVEEIISMPINENIETISLLEAEEKQYQTIEYIHTVKKVIKKQTNKFISSIIFLTKYLITTTLIFAVLLVTTNYTAYINVAKSYIFSWELEVKQQRLISSVEAVNIKEKYSEEKIEEIKVEKKEKNKLSIKKMKKEQDKENLNLNIEITPYENRIIIPKIGKNIPLIDIKNRSIKWEEELNNIFMDELENGVIRYPGSAKPGEDGTSFIFGHSSNFPWMKWDYNEVFALLDKVVYWDEIIVYYGQEKYTYKIREKKIITPGDVSVLERNKDRSEITLMTCWPIGTTLNRLIVVWELVEKK